MFFFSLLQERKVVMWRFIYFLMAAFRFNKINLCFAHIYQSPQAYTFLLPLTKFPTQEVFNKPHFL